MGWFFILERERNEELGIRSEEWGLGDM